MNNCPAHPKYKGKKKPKIACSICLGIYLKMQKHKHRAPIKPTKVIPDKKKYNRKKKHKKDNTDRI